MIARPVEPDERHPMADALYVVATSEDVVALRHASLAAAILSKPTELRDLVRQAARAGAPIVVVHATDGEAVRYLGQECPQAEIRELGLPPGYDSVAAVFRWAPSVDVDPWDEATAREKRITWTTWAAEHSVLAHAAEEPAADGRVPFPIDALPPAVRLFVEHGAAAQGVDVASWGVMVLGVLSGCVGATRTVRLKRTWDEPAILWTALIGPSGMGKTVPFRSCLVPVRDHDHQLSERTKLAQLAYEAELDQRRANKVDGPPPPAPRMLAALIDDATVEAIAVRLADNPRGLLLAVDELAGWIKGQNKYRQGDDSQRWLQFHNCGDLKVDRKGGSGGSSRIHVRRAGVSVVGTLQPEIARRFLGSAESRASGQAARILLAAPPVQPVLWTDRTIPPEIEAAYGRVVRGLLDLTMGEDAPKALPLDLEARERFRAYHDDNGQACAVAAQSGDHDVAAALSKLRGSAARLALVLALAREAEGGTAETLWQVDDQAMAAGIELARWFELEARRIYASWAAAEPDEQPSHSVARLRQRLEGILMSGVEVSLDELHRRTGRNVKAALLRSTLQTMQEAGDVTSRRIENPRGGRPKEVWQWVS